jgi:peptidoglycan/LPS O-acetylase OafA/YrhL
VPLSRDKIEHRAIKTGIKTSKKRGHLVTEEELLKLRVQTMPAPLRILLVLLGIGLLASGWFAWPSDSNTVQGLEAIAGILLMAFGAFGIRRTLEGVLDSVDAVDLAGTILESIGDALSGIDFF